MKPPLRTKSVGTKVSEAEFALLEERARGAGMRLGEWVREALLSAPAESQQSGPDSGEVALAEVLALRSLLLNLHFLSATIPGAIRAIRGHDIYSLLTAAPVVWPLVPSSVLVCGLELAWQSCVPEPLRVRRVAQV